MTNAAGQFVARGLRTGTLFLTATKGGYINATNAQRRPNGSAQPIQVAAGQRVTDVEVRMWRRSPSSAPSSTRLASRSSARACRRSRASSSEAVRATLPAVGCDRRSRDLPSGGSRAGRLQDRRQFDPGLGANGFVDSLLRGSADARRLGLAHDMAALGAAIAPAGTQFALRSESQTISLRSGTATPIPRDDGSFLIYPTTFYPVAQTSSHAPRSRSRRVKNNPVSISSCSRSVRSKSRATSLRLTAWPATCRCA